MSRGIAPDAGSAVGQAAGARPMNPPPLVAPGPWLRMTALVAAGGTVLAVVSGVAHLGTTHRVLAALVAPPLAALLVSAWLAHRRLAPAVLGSGALFAAAAAVPGTRLHDVFVRNMSTVHGRPVRIAVAIAEPRPTGQLIPRDPRHAHPFPSSADLLSAAQTHADTIPMRGFLIDEPDDNDGLGGVLAKIS